jgi:carbonic anhydrase
MKTNKLVKNLYKKLFNSVIIASLLLLAHAPAHARFVAPAQGWQELAGVYHGNPSLTPGFKKAIQGYEKFREKYVLGDAPLMQQLYEHGQKPEILVIACSDSRVDPALITQAKPGELFVVRNVASLVPPYELGGSYHGTSAALEYATKKEFLNVKHIVILGHSKCGGVQASLDGAEKMQSDFIGDWVSLIKKDKKTPYNSYDYAKKALLQSRNNCMTFPWVKDRIERGDLQIHLWFFDIERGEIFTYQD